MLVQVQGRSFAARLEFEDGVVVRAAPVLMWAVGRNRDWLREYFKSKGWTAKVVKND